MSEELRKYLEWRIRWHSGGGELKSMAESVSDEMIVEELQDALDVLDGKLPHRREGNRKDIGPWRQPKEQS